MESQLFIIKKNNGVYGFYSNLETAKKELKNIYDSTPDYKHYGYEINVHNLVNGEYIKTPISYTYRFDIFLIHSENIKN